MILINSVSYDEESREADVKLTSMGASIVCYCHPAENLDQIYKSIKNPLVAFLVSNIMVDNDNVYKIQKTNHGYYSYFLCGKVISNTKIQVEDFIIEIGALPNDIEIGKYVSCYCLRLDIMI
ncbi:MAG: hypothetical protein IJW03_04435 [Clostridia bacterium]|nr:hypothetical protein [Clostridia bacterium]